jgi:hypothetical protein
MSIQIASADGINIQTLFGASSLHLDDSKIIVIIDVNHLSDEQESQLETDGLLVGLNIEDEMIATKTQIILTPKSRGGSVDGLNDNQIIIEFEI